MLLGSWARTILFGWKSDWRLGCEEGARRAGFNAAMQPIPLSNFDQFDAIIPLTLDDQFFIDEFMAAGRDLPALVVPAVKREICHDKLAFSRCMTAIGFGDYIPKSCDLGSIELNDFPLVVKQRKGEWGHGTAIINNNAELESHISAVLSGHAFVQEYVPGADEYAAHLLIHQGTIAYSVVVKHEFSTAGIYGYRHRPIKVSWLSRSPFDPLWTKILFKLGISSGTVCIDYRIRGDQPVIFEINPRVGASLTWNMKDYLRIYLELVQSPNSRPVKLESYV